MWTFWAYRMIMNHKNPLNWLVVSNILLFPPTNWGNNKFWHIFFKWVEPPTRLQIPTPWQKFSRPKWHNHQEKKWPAVFFSLNHQFLAEPPPLLFKIHGFFSNPCLLLGQFLVNFCLMCRRCQNASPVWRCYDGLELLPAAGLGEGSSHIPWSTPRGRGKTPFEGFGFHWAWSLKISGTWPIETLKDARDVKIAWQDDQELSATIDALPGVFTGISVTECPCIKRTS